MIEAPDFALEVDASGLTCPLPILRAKKALAQIESGKVLHVITTDPKAEHDFQAFCQQSGNALICQIVQAPYLHHYLRRR